MLQIWKVVAAELHACQLDATAMQLLVQGNWPSLVQLDLKGSILGPAGCEMFSHARWPLLKVLKVSGTVPQSTQVAKDGCAIATECIANLT